MKLFKFWKRDELSICGICQCAFLPAPNVLERRWCGKCLKEGQDKEREEREFQWDLDLAKRHRKEFKEWANKVREKEAKKSAAMAKAYIETMAQIARSQMNAMTAGPGLAGLGAFQAGRQRG